MQREVISNCPVCDSHLTVTRLHCNNCGTTIEGEFTVGRFSRLNREQYALLESFLRSRGNLRELERELGVSYPTVRNRVEALLRALDLADGAPIPPTCRGHRGPRTRGRRRRHAPIDPRAPGAPRAERRAGRRRPARRIDRSDRRGTCGEPERRPAGEAPQEAGRKAPMDEHTSATRIPPRSAHDRRQRAADDQQRLRRRRPACRRWRRGHRRRSGQRVAAPSGCP